MSQFSRKTSEAIVRANLTGVSPAERSELISSIERRLGDEVISLFGDRVTVRTDNQARVTRFISGFGGLIEQFDIDQVLDLMVAEGLQPKDALALLL